MLLAAALAGCRGTGLTLAELERPRAQPVSVIYRTIDGRALHLLVSYPHGAGFPARGPRPAALVCIHGGGWGSGTPEYMAHVAEYFARRGMVTLNIEYRISEPKADPRMAIHECIRDCQAAIRFVRANADELGLDPDRIAVIGDSAGGHLAACLGTLPDLEKPPEHAAFSARANAMILCNPIVDLTTLAWRKGVPGVGTPVPDDAESAALTPEERGRAISPIYHIDAHTPPTLMIHGTADTCVDVEQADRFVARMKQAGIRCDYARQEDWKHAFVIRPPYGTEETVMESLRLTDAFLTSLGYTVGPGPD
jgi:acetyl esterase/lipase